MKWTPENVTKFKELAEKGYTHEEIAQEFNTTIPSIQGEAMKLGVYCRRKGHWTPEEIEMLQKCYQEGKSLTETSKILTGRPIGAIKIKCLKLGIYIKNIKQKFWTDDKIDELKELINKEFTYKQMADHFGVSYNSILNCCRRCNLSITTRLSSEEIEKMRQYVVEQNLPMQRIASLLNVDRRTVLFYSKKLNWRTPTKEAREKREEFLNKYKNDPEKLNVAQLLCKKIVFCRTRAKQNSIVFNITRENLMDIYERQDGLCFYSGVKMKIQNNRRNSRNLFSMSIDRFDSDYGYTFDNVVFCCDYINIMKHSQTKETLLDFCRLISNYNDKPDQDYSI
jgi:hypothetical protein